MMKMNKERNISATPQRWVIVGFKKGEQTYHKVFASWAGGYLDGDSWRMNSGIARVEEDDRHFYFYGFSGSCYKCHKDGYGIATAYSQSVLEGSTEKAKELGGVEMWVMAQDNDWMKLLNTDNNE